MLVSGRGAGITCRYVPLRARRYEAEADLIIATLARHRVELVRDVKAVLAAKIGQFVDVFLDIDEVRVWNVCNVCNVRNVCNVFLDIDGLRVCKRP